jgi:hypothetical protein
VALYRVELTRSIYQQGDETMKKLLSVIVAAAFASTSFGVAA